LLLKYQKNLLFVSYALYRELVKLFQQKLTTSEVISCY